MKVLIVLSAVVAVTFAFGKAPVARSLSQTADIQPDGTYNWAYETPEGIMAEEAGQGGVQVTGRYAYISPEGENIEVSYVADSEGFKPSNLPVGPAIPEYIARALEYIASQPAYEDEFTKSVPQSKAAAPVKAFKPAVKAAAKPFGGKFGKF